MSAKKEISPGTRFGRWVVLGPFVPGTAKTHYKLLVRCDCGVERTIAARDLRRGATKSCGCGMAETLSARFTKHGHTVGRKYSPEFRAWAGAKDRCHNPNTERWLDYGGRGVTMSDLWRDDFARFLEDVGPRPSPKHSLDRYPDNDGNYEPGNVRWATAKEQRANQRQRDKVAQLKNFTDAELLAELARRDYHQQAKDQP